MPDKITITDACMEQDSIEATFDEVEELFTRGMVEWACEHCAATHPFQRSWQSYSMDDLREELPGIRKGIAFRDNSVAS